MYENLKVEMLKSGITKREMAEFLGVHENTVFNKIEGVSDFSIEEAFQIKKHFFPAFELSYLFSKFQESA